MNQGIKSLQEKFTLVREQIPALVKKKYSDEVDYDFVKIDDIFKYLTPALNTFKVNYEIVSEKATKRDEQGNVRYLEYLEMCNLWLYEADLTILWINAEQPDDTFEVKIHAIGTHEMPDKAKGSAWTYCFKYYFLDKFGVDQGGEDPDMRGMHGANEDVETNADGFYDESWGFVSDDSHEPMFPSDPYEDMAAFSEHDMIPSPIGPEHGVSVSLPESASQSRGSVRRSAEEMTIEDARDVVCNFGLHIGKRLGDLAIEGDVETLKWFAESYRGPNQYLRKGAQILLDAANAA